jgi:hypothetical protein
MVWVDTTTLAVNNKLINCTNSQPHGSIMHAIESGCAPNVGFDLDCRTGRKDYPILFLIH